MMDMDLMFIPLALFMMVVAPLWLILHYRSKKVAASGLSEEQTEALVRLCEQTEKMGKRIETLEQILDAEAPQWRSQR